MSYTPLVTAPEAAWEEVETPHQSRDTLLEPQIKNVQQLIALKHHHFIKYIKEHTFKKIGEIEVPSALAFEKLGHDMFITAGSETTDIDVSSFWGKELGLDTFEEPVWSENITLDAYVVTIKNVSAPDREGLVHHLLGRFRAGACSHRVFGLPLVQVVLDFKWKKFAWRLLVVEMAFFLAWFIGFNVFTLLFQDEDLDSSLGDLWSGNTHQGNWGKVTILSEVVALIGMTPFLLIEVATILMYGTGWFGIWNTLDMITYTAQISLGILHLARLHLHSDWVSTIMAVQHVALCFRLNFFTRVFRATRFSFLDALKEVINEVKWFLFFVLLMVWGFCCAFYIIFRSDQETIQDFSTIRTSFLTTFNYALGGVDISLFTLAKHNQVTAMTLLFFYQFVMVMVLMSLLVGLMSNAMDRATSNEDLKYLQSKAEIIDELETSIPAFIEDQFRDWYPKYLHVLRLDVDKLDPILQDMLVLKNNMSELNEGDGDDDDDDKKDDDKKDDDDKDDDDDDDQSLKKQLADLHEQVGRLTAAFGQKKRANGTS